MEFISDKTRGFSELFAQLAAGALLLTVNNRLAKRFTEDYNRRMESAGEKVWKTPDILPLSAWLGLQMEKLSDSGILHSRILSTHQESRIWIDIIEPDAWQTYIMQSAAIARPVQQAWQLLKQWQIPYRDIAAFETPETRALLHWCSQFDERCRNENWLSQTLIIDKVAKAIANQQCKPEPQIIFAGFEDPHTLHQNLVTSLASRQCKVSYFQHDNINKKLAIRACNEFQDELQQSAQWARELLQKDPSRKIAIVIPSLNENRSQVEHTFRRILHPERINPPPFLNNNLYNLSLGLPLAQYPLVHNALLSLSLVAGLIPADTISTILRAPFLLAATDAAERDFVTRMSERARVDLMLRKHGRKQWTIKALRIFLQNNTPAGTLAAVSDLTQRLDKLLELKQQTRTSQTAEQHSKTFLEIWKIMGWPGSRSLESHTYQQSERLLKLLSEFRLLDTVKNQLPFSEAISILRQMCNETIFQEQSDDSPVLVSGLLEASEQQFDYLWLAGLDDKTLPLQATPNPFIPIAIQKQFNLPHCSAERDFSFSEKLFHLFIETAENIVISYPLHDGDQQLNPSPFIKNHIATETTENTSAAVEDFKHSVTLQSYIDHQLPALEKKRTVKGGTAILSQQAVCPFQAAASFRLQASEPEAIIDGASPMDKGNQVHKILEIVWKQLRTQKDLLNLDDVALRHIVETSVEKVMSFYQHQRPDLYQANFLALEKQRLGKLVMDWLEVDKQRPLDFSVEEIEQDKTLEIGGLVFKTRVDRIDKLENEQRILLDYKTGQHANSNSWLKEQITEPQLPLYSINESEKLAALALAKVTERQCGFSGLAHSDNILPGIKAFVLPDEMHNNDNQDDWTRLQQIWKQRLTKLAEAYRHGEASINPDNCQYCHFDSLCRKQVMTDNIS